MPRISIWGRSLSMSAVSTPKAPYISLLITFQYVSPSESSVAAFRRTADGGSVPPVDPIPKPNADQGDAETVQHLVSNAMDELELVVRGCGGVTVHVDVSQGSAAHWGLDVEWSQQHCHVDVIVSPAEEPGHLVMHPRGHAGVGLSAVVPVASATASWMRSRSSAMSRVRNRSSLLIGTVR